MNYHFGRKTSRNYFVWRKQMTVYEKLKRNFLSIKSRILKCSKSPRNTRHYSPPLKKQARKALKGGEKGRKEEKTSIHTRSFYPRWSASPGVAVGISRGFLAFFWPRGGRGRLSSLWDWSSALEGQEETFASSDQSKLSAEFVVRGETELSFGGDCVQEKKTSRVNFIFNFFPFLLWVLLCQCVRERVRRERCCWERAIFEDLREELRSVASCWLRDRNNFGKITKLDKANNFPK